MKRKNLFITIFVIVVGGLGLILFVGEALSQEEELEQEVATEIEPGETEGTSTESTDIGLTLDDSTFLLPS